VQESIVLLVLVIFLGLIFDAINGFHDAANAIATSVSTRVLSPRTAIVMAAVLNLAGALAGTEVAKTVGAGLVLPSAVTQLTVVSALLSATVWNLITWYFGLPTSSSHALMASIVGAGIATAGTGVVLWSGTQKVLLAIVFSPFIGFLFGFILMVILMWVFSKAVPTRVTAIFRILQLFSAAYMAFSHGNNDAQKTMGIITMSLVSFYGLKDFHVPFWVIVCAALAMGFGTAIGGWRIIRTLGMRLVPLKPIHGFAAEASAATVIEVASHLGLPISTTHVIASSIMGVGASRRFSAVRWGVGWNIVIAWVLTLPACGLIAWSIMKILSEFFRSPYV